MKINRSDYHNDWDEIKVSRTGPQHADVLGPFCVVMQSGRASLQTYMTRDELNQHVCACNRLLAT